MSSIQQNHSIEHLKSPPPQNDPLNLMRQMIGLEHDQISDMLLKSLNQQLMWLIEKIARLLIGENGEYLRFFFGKKKKRNSC